MRDGEGSFGRAGKVSDMHRRERCVETWRLLYTWIEVERI